MKKEVFVVLNEYPFGTNHLAEKLRMSLGLTINSNISLNLVFLDKGKNGLRKLDEAAVGIGDITKNINMLSEMGAKFFVEDGGDTFQLDNITPESFLSGELEKVINNADIIIN